MFPSVPWQRCLFHLQQNAGAYVSRQGMRKPVAAAIRDIFNAPDIDEAKRLLERFVAKYESKAPKLAAWAADAIPEAFAVFALPAVTDVDCAPRTPWNALTRRSSVGHAWPPSSRTSNPESAWSLRSRWRSPRSGSLAESISTWRPT